MDTVLDYAITIRIYYASSIACTFNIITLCLLNNFLLSSRIRSSKVHSNDFRAVGVVLKRRYQKILCTIILNNSDISYNKNCLYGEYRVEQIGEIVFENYEVSRPRNVLWIIHAADVWEKNCSRDHRFKFFFNSDNSTNDLTAVLINQKRFRDVLPSSIKSGKSLSD